MGLLDAFTIDWTQPEPRELRYLLLLAYDDLAAAKRITREAGLAPGTFSQQDRLLETWHFTLEQLARQGKLRALVEAAMRDPSAAAHRARLGEFLGDRPAVAAPSPVGDRSFWRAEPEPEASRLQRLMLDRSRLLPVGLARLVAERARSVAKLSLDFSGSAAHGTGFLIQPDLLLTVRHNVVHPERGRVTSIVADFDDEQGFTAKREVRRGTVRATSADDAHDWAVIALERPVDRPPLRLGSTFEPGPRQTVIIIQHPLGGAKHFTIDHLSIRHVDERVIQYAADTLKGSSGSPVFNDALQLIALHHAEAPAKIVVAGQPGTEWRNQGIRVERVISDLKSAGIPCLEGA